MFCLCSLLEVLWFQGLCLCLQSILGLFLHVVWGSVLVTSCQLCVAVQLFQHYLLKTLSFLDFLHSWPKQWLNEKQSQQEAKAQRGMEHAQDRRQQEWRQAWGRQGAAGGQEGVEDTLGSGPIPAFHQVRFTPDSSPSILFSIHSPGKKQEKSPCQRI